MKIETIDEIYLGSYHEVIEAFVDQRVLVIITKYETVFGSIKDVWEYTEIKLPEGFHGPQDASRFRTEKPLAGYEGAVEVRCNYGEVVRQEYYTTLTEATAELTTVLLSRDR